MPTKSKYEEESDKTVASVSLVLTAIYLVIFVIFMMKGGDKVVNLKILPVAGLSQTNGRVDASASTSASDPIESIVAIKGQWSRIIPTTESGKELGRIDFRSERSEVLIDVMVSLGDGQERVYNNLESGSTRVPPGLSYRFRISSQSSHDSETLYLKKIK